MEETVVLQVILHGDEGLEIRLGNENSKINPLMLVGILEQVKMNVLSSGSSEMEESMAKEVKPKYDA
jgi:hypothetical protein